MILNVEDDREAEVVEGVRKHGLHVIVELNNSGIIEEEVKVVVSEMKARKATHLDGYVIKCLKSGRAMLLLLTALVILLNVCFMSILVSINRVNVCVVSLYEGDKYEFTSFRQGKDDCLCCTHH